MTYIRYPAGGSGITTYANFAAFPASAADGTVALALDTDVLYAYNSNSSSWVVIGGPGSVLTIGTIDSQTASANGAVISANSLVMQSGSATRPGLVNITTQSFAGNKTFTGIINLSAGGAVGAPAFYLSTDSTTGFYRPGVDQFNLGVSGAVVANWGTSGMAITGLISATSSIAGSFFKSLTANGASAGQIRLANTELIEWRNAANNGNMTLSVDSSDIFQFNGAMRSSSTITAVTSVTSADFISSTANAASYGVLSLANTEGIGWRNAANNGNFSLILTAADVFTFDSSLVATNLSGTNTGDVTLGAFGSSPSATGASLSGQVLTMQPADGTHPGMVSIASQSIAGAKTFTSAMQITGSADAIQLNVLSNATQTQNPFQVLTSGSSNLLNLTPVGNLLINGTFLAGGVITGTQLVSTIAIGTAPLVVTSTTQVTNLNAATSGTATNATNVATTATNSTNASFFPTFVASSSSSNQGIDTASGITFNPSTNNLATTTFTGALTGHASADIANTLTTTTGDMIYASSANTPARLAIGSTGNVLTVAGGIPSWAPPATSGTVTSVAMSVPAASLFSISGSPITSSGTLALTTAGTSGGIPYFSSTTQLNSSALLTANQLIIGGGAGAAPATLAAGSQYQVLRMGATTPAYGSINLDQSAAVTGALPIGNGGTGQITKAAAFDALSPMTTGGDLIYGGASGTGTRLANGTAGQFLQSNGTTTAPTWVAASPLTTKGDLYTYSTVNARQAVGTDGQGIIADSNQTNGIRYQDCYPKNYIVNSDAEVGTEGWATYADAAGNIPVDGTGGTATSLTFSRSTSSPLDGVGSFSMAQANSTSLQGKGVSYAFTIDSADQAKPLAIQFNYNASSTFVAANGITAPLNDGTTTTNAGNSDIEVFIYDVTNAVLIYVSPEVITANGANNFSFKGTFQTASNSTSYRLIFHVATTSANATGWTFKYDRVYVGTQISYVGSPITDWSAYTPTFVGFGTVASVQVYYKRVGDSLLVQGTFTNGTPTSTIATISLPSVTIDYTKISTSSAMSEVGIIMASTGANTDISIPATTMAYLFVDGSDATHIYLSLKSASAAFVKKTPNDFTTANDPITFNFQVPIAGWASTTVMSNDTDTRVVSARVTGSTSTINGTAALITYTTIAHDTHAAYSTSTGLYTVPVSGLYRVFGQVYSTQASIAAGSLGEIYIYKNGVSVSRYIFEPSGTANNDYHYPVTSTISCVAGDTLAIYFQSGATTPVVQNSAPSTYACFDRLSGPAAIAATESVNARYYSSVTAISGSLATVVYATKDYDSHNGYASGIYTVPISGKYQVNAAIGNSGTFALNSLLTMEIQKNSSVYSRVKVYSGGIETQVDGLVADQMACVAGDTIRVQISNSGTSPVIVTSNFENYISIFRTGN